MAYIGSKPADKVLTSDDITDGVISTAKIQDNAVTTAKTSYSDAPFRNIIINGDMSIAQRGTSKTGLGNGDVSYYTVDRWRFIALGTPTFEFTMSQDTDVPSGQGFAKSLKLDCTTAQTDLGTSNHLFIGQKIEGQNLQYLKKGTANAESLTLSFWVKSNKTGTYTVYPYDNDNNRLISAAYTINSANTWEKKTITYAGDTSGALDNDNNSSLEIYFNLALGTDRTSGTLATSWEDTVSANLGVGQVNLADNTANEFYITGIQLEAGTTASDFEFLPVDVNLQRCQRYYYLHASGLNQHINMSAHYNSTYIVGHISFPVEMRVAPTLVHSTGSNYYRFFRNGTTDEFDSFSEGLARPTKNSASLENSTGVSGTAGDAGATTTLNASAFIAMQSEL